MSACVNNLTDLMTYKSSEGQTNRVVEGKVRLGETMTSERNASFATVTGCLAFFLLFFPSNFFRDMWTTQKTGTAVVVLYVVIARYIYLVQLYFIFESTLFMVAFGNKFLKVILIDQGTSLLIEPIAMIVFLFICTEEVSSALVMRQASENWCHFFFIVFRVLNPRPPALEADVRLTELSWRLILSFCAQP